MLDGALRAGSHLLPDVKEFKYLTGDKLEHGIKWRIGIVDRVKLEGKAFNLPLGLLHDPELWS